MVEAGGMSEFVYGLDEGSPGEEFGAGLQMIELRAESGETDECAAAADYPLSEDEVDIGRKEIRVDDTQGPDLVALFIDQGIQDRTSPILVAAGIEPFGE
jgi:hypothetical protein